MKDFIHFVRCLKPLGGWPTFALVALGIALGMTYFLPDVHILLKLAVYAVVGAAYPARMDYARYFGDE